VSEHAGDPVAQRAAVEAWKKKRAHVVEVFEVAFESIAGAAVVSDEPSLAGMSKAAGALSDELRTLGVQP
jgi:hypothetical protein